MKAVYLLGMHALNANISFTFHAVKNLSSHPTFQAVL